MSSSSRRMIGFSLILAALLLARPGQVCSAQEGPKKDAWGYYASVLSAVSQNDPSSARRLLAAMGKVDVKNLPSLYRRRLETLKLWYFPPPHFSGKTVRQINRSGGEIADILFWHAMNGGRVPASRIPGLRAKFARMYPFSPLANGPGRSGKKTARSLWLRSLESLKNGDNLTADSIWKELVAKHPLAPESGLAMVRLKTAGETGDVLIPRWIALSKLGMGAVASREIKDYLALGPPFPYRDLAAIIRSTELTRENKRFQARSLLSGVLSAKGIHLDSLLTGALCQTYRRPEKTAGCVNSFLGRYPGSVFGRILVNGLLRQEIALGKKTSSPSWKPSESLLSTVEGQDSLWLYGLSAYLAGNREEAKNDWGRLVDYYNAAGDPTGFRLARAEYFLGRLSSLSGDPDLANAFFRKVISDAPDTPYAMWATIACRSGCPALPVNLHRPAHRGKRWSSRNRTRILSLIQLGLWGPALLLSEMHRDGGRLGFRVLRYGNLDLEVFPEEKYRIVREAVPLSPPGIRLAKSEKITGFILSGIRRSGADPEWVVSIARQESRFSGKALSIDGALGIMQLMPPTALSVARQSGSPVYPDIVRNLGNIRLQENNSYLGGLYLKRLMDKYPHNPERAVASYNAGMHSVVRWTGLEKEDWDFFVEGIPFKETRRYDREVLWNYLFIHRSGLLRKEG